MGQTLFYVRRISPPGVWGVLLTGGDVSDSLPAPLAPVPGQARGDPTNALIFSMHSLKSIGLEM